MSNSDTHVERQAAVGARADLPDRVTDRWRPATLLAAPHRLGFFCAVVVLIAASLWWLLEQLDRYLGGSLGLGVAMSPTLTHGTVMVFGFMPLFFSGFLFTAGPKWLDVPPWTPRQLLPPLALQAAGWLLWLLGGMWAQAVAVLGVLLALVGLAWMYLLYWSLVRASTRPDQRHARTIGTGGIVGVLCLAGVAVSLLAGQYGWVLTLVRTALWGFIVVTFVSVAHRMIPFFTHGKVPGVEAWRPYWILGLMVAIAAFEVLAVWVDALAPAADSWPAWTWLRIVVESAAGLAMLWLVLVWGLMRSLRIPLLVMLHIGFTWLGLTLLYSALSQLLWLLNGTPILGLGALHALSMGFLGSLILAMVTRVTAGHSGRPLVAGRLAWGLFLLLQVTVIVRLLAAVRGVPLAWTLAAALLWAAIVTVWGLRFASWYGRPRVDGKPG